MVETVEQSDEVMFELVRDGLSVVLGLAADIVFDSSLRVGVAGGGDGRRRRRHGHGRWPSNVAFDHLACGGVVLGSGRRRRLTPQQLVFDTVDHVVNTVQVSIV